MKRISVLKTIVTIAFIISVIIVAFGVPFTLMLAVGGDMVPQGVKGNISANHLSGTGAILYLLLALASTGIIALALRTFKQSLTLFEKRIFFDNRVITQLLKTGKAFVAAALLTIASEVVAMLFAPSGPHIQVSFTYGPTLLLASLGLLFMVLSDVFTMAKNLKEENDLTV
jgi:Protein of unknown function (DUF2975)